MKKYETEDTIAAIATPFGQGAIAIVRMSGERAFEIVEHIFHSQKNFAEVENWKATYGKIYDEKSFIDEVIVLKYQRPHSFSGEDMVEINCHGGVYVSQRVLEVILKNGARLAEPGEFTLRAFLNGRLDLSQAEAVSDLIQSQTEFSLQASLRQLEGKLSRRISEIHEQLVHALSLLELELDFAEEDVEFVDRAELISQVDKIRRELAQLIDSYQSGRIARDGVKLVIAGKPNVGKSSLLNALANEERAIVTDIPGTTRDALEIRLDIQGILFRVFDTAGIKQSSDIVEKEGIRRTRKYVSSADIIIHVFDGSCPLSAEDMEIKNYINQQQPPGVIRVLNKSDLALKIKKNELFENNVKILQVSALKKRGIKQLEEELISLVKSMAPMQSSEVMVTNLRHLSVLKRAVESLDKTKEELEKGMSSEFVAVYLREALDHLGEISGKATSEDILNHIFSQFCIGK